jgi:xylulokinase
MFTLAMRVDRSGRNADVPRALVRDMYTKSWSAFDRLVDIVPPGGSIG